MIDIPEGFERMPGPGFEAHVGPFYQCKRDGHVIVGIRLGEHHCNRMRVAHGGFLAMFCDIMMGASVLANADRKRVASMLTVSMHIDYIGNACINEWLEGWAEVPKKGGRLAFANGNIVADGRTVLHASAVFKLIPPQTGVEALPSA